MEAEFSMISVDQSFFYRILRLLHLLFVWAKFVLLSVFGCSRI